MRILHLIESLGRGGAEQMVATLAIEQRRQGHHVTVVSLCEPSAFAPELRAGDVAVEQLALSGRKHAARAVLGLAWAALKRRPDVVHTHLLFSEFYAGVTPLPGAKRIATFHNLGPLAVEPSRKQRAIFVAEAVVLRTRFDACVGVSRATAEVYRRELGLPRVEVIANPVDREALLARAPSLEQARTKLAIVAGAPVVVVVAKHTPEKAIDVLLRALATLERGTVRLALVGQGPLTTQLRSLAAELGLERDIRWVGEVASHEVVDWLSAANVVVLPSRSEGLPITLLEAMALGKPIVATRVGGIPEALHDRESGLLVEPNDPSSLALALTTLLSDSELATRLGAAAGRRAMDYSPTSIATAYQAVYERR